MAKSANAGIEIDVIELAKVNVLMEVKLKNWQRFRIRLWLVLALLRLLEIVAPFGIEVEKVGFDEQS